jgi:sulfate transport system ATP-binding protein
VHEFLGDTNRLACRVEGGRVLLADGTCLGRVEAASGDAVAYVRPHDITLHPAGDGTGIVRHAQLAGPLARLIVEIGPVSIDVAIAADAAVMLGLQRGDRVAIGARAGMVFPLPAARGAPLMPVGRALSLAFARAT